uniref:flotillin family protein n=1 Tax=uncultured Thioclava sp. TaxID=473858 RepID=UPI0026008E14
MNSLLPILIPVGIAIIAILALGFMLARLYQKASRETALVKTGVGGLKVIMDGGTIAFPVLHEITQVNMLTTRLEVRRTGEGALITKDRMRVDAGVEFYVTVKATAEGVAKAAQTLGERTFDAHALREMIEGKLVDGLRAVAAQMDLDDLHEKRSEFVQQVQNAVSGDLEKNGLALESVALTALDQTPMESLDQNNVFNAVGLKIVAERAAESRKKRAAIEAEADLAVATAKQAAAVKTYGVEQQQEEARVEQQKRMDALKAEEIAAKAEADERSLQASRAAEIERERAIRVAEEESKKTVEIAEQNRKIEIAKKSEEESKAQAQADTAKAEAVKASEAITTAREIAEAERTKQISLLKAQEEAERDATGIRVSAKAEREAAEDRAAARRELAQASADEISINAKAMKEAKLAEADGIRAVNEADSLVSAEILAFRLNGLRLEALPAILEAMMRPAEKI